MTADLGRSDTDDAPSGADLDATDHFLSSIATHTATVDGVTNEPLTDLLRSASGPAGAGELVGEEQFVAAVSSQDVRTRRTATSPAVLVGRAVAAKAALIAAMTVLGIATAGAATGVILHVANDPGPQPVVTVDDPDGTPPDTDGDWELGETTRDGGRPGADADPVRIRTCAAATGPTGLAQLARAATVASTTADDYCRGTGTVADPDRSDVDTPTDRSPSADDPSASERPASDPEAPPTDPGPPAGDGGPNNDNGGSANGNSGGSSSGTPNGGATPGTPNTNANPKAGNGATNGGGSNTGVPNGGATPGTPNTNANPDAGAGSGAGAGLGAGPGAAARPAGGPRSDTVGNVAAPDGATDRPGAAPPPGAAGAATPRGSGVRPDRER